MAVVRLNVRTIEAAPVGDRDVFLWDETLRGFGLKITKAGKKIYVVQYRMGGRGSSTRRFTIGQHGTWTPIRARAEAERLLRTVASGVDPQAEAKNQERRDRESRFDKYADHFLQTYCARQWRPRTYAAAASNMRRWIIPGLGKKALAEITRRDLIAVLDRVPATKPALPRNLFALLRRLFSWATERGDLDRSPMDGMRPPKSVPSRERTLTDEELFFLLPCVADVGEPFCTLIRFLVLTGQRRNEVSGMAWAELDRDRKEWTIPGSRTKNKREHVVPLAQIAVVELDRLALGQRWPRRGFVFSTTGVTAVSGFSRVKRRLDRILVEVMKREIPAWRFHDLRRTFATNLQRLDVRWEITEALLNHVSGSRSGVAGVYQRHDWSREKHEAMDRWNERVAAILFVEGHAKFTDGKLPSKTNARTRADRKNG